MLSLNELTGIAGCAEHGGASLNDPLKMAAATMYLNRDTAELHRNTVMAMLNFVPAPVLAVIGLVDYLANADSLQAGANDTPTSERLCSVWRQTSDEHLLRKLTGHHGRSANIAAAC